MRGETDAELVTRAVDGSEKAFRYLVERHRALAWAVVRGVLGDRDDVEDVLQEVFIKVYRGLPSFRREARFSSWLYRIARNEALNAASKQRPATDPIEDVPLAAPRRSGPDEQYRRAHEREALNQALGSLDDNYRIVLELRYLADHTYDEISDIMDIPIGTVKTYIYRAKAELKKKMTASPLQRTAEDS